MHVLFITGNTEFLNTEGKERKFLRGLMDASDTLHIIVLTSWWSKHAVQQLDEHTWVYPTNAPFGLQFFRILRIARFQLFWKREFRAHIIHSDDLQTTAWAALFLSYLYDRVWVANVHSYGWDMRSLGKSPLSRFRTMPLLLLFSCAFRVCIFSDLTRLHLLSKLKKHWEKKIYPFPKLYDPELIGKEVAAFNIKEKHPEMQFALLVVARLGRRRDVSLALQTLKLLRKNQYYPKAGLVIIGKGVAAFWVRLWALMHGLSAWVFFESPRADFTSLVKTSNLFLYLSGGDENEDLLIRAAAAHCPIIAIDDKLTRELIKDGVNGSILRTRAPKILVETIIKINQSADRELFKINSGLFLEQTVVATEAQVIAALKALWEYQAAPMEQKQEMPDAAYINPHPLEPAPPTRIEKFKAVWAEMFPSK
jgi:glycosyltransferase involved in cell wall biosynthesis